MTDGDDDSWGGPVWTERDQIQAYQFLRRRLVSALTTADPNHPVAPNRRLVLGVVLGGVATMLTCVGFGVSGLMQPAPPPDWKHTGIVILTDDGGGQYVLDKDGVLHPVSNLASARLLANSAKTVTVARPVLDGTPRGAALGIPGAPGALPGPGDLIGLVTPVSCSRATSDLPKVTGPVGALLLVPSSDPTASLTGMVALPDTHGLLVQNPKGDRFLVTGGVKYPVPDRGALIALQYQSTDPLPVAQSWLATLPTGRDLKLVSVAGAGNNGPRVGTLHTRVGQVLTADNHVAGKSGYYLVRADGLEPIPQMEAALIIADTANGNDTAGHTVSVGDAAAAPAVAPADDAAGYPAGMPTPAPTAGRLTVVCATGDGTNPASVALGTALPLPQTARTIPTDVATGGATADEVYVPPGSGVLLTTAHTGADSGPTATPAATANGTSAPADPWYLVTDGGTKFRIGDSQARQALGYGSVAAVGVSEATLTMLPTGPTLDAVSAQKPVAVKGD